MRHLASWVKTSPWSQVYVMDWWIQAVSMDYDYLVDSKLA